ncbi:MAG: glycosyltransferase [Calditrichaeota bacterium]|nr:glycosyltransferase [Calditrichota bacterium]
MLKKANKIEIFPARSGTLTMRISGNMLHSLYDPVKEAQTIAKAALADVPEEAPVVILGLGLGYLAQAVKALHRGSLAVVEADDAVARAALSAQPWLEHNDVLYLAGQPVAKVVENIFNTLPVKGRYYFVRNAPSVKLHPDYYSEIERLLAERSRANIERLNILVSTPFYGGSLPIARYCAAALTRLGHNVITLDNAVFEPLHSRIESNLRSRHYRHKVLNQLTSVAADEIVLLAEERAIDLVFLVAQSLITPEALSALRQMGVPTAFWFVEEWQLFTYWQEWATRYDYFFTIQKGEFLSALAQRGNKKAKYLPLAADPFVHRPLELSALESVAYGSDISHIGAGYRNRRVVFSGLQGFDFKLWGNDWNGAGALEPFLQRNGERISTEETVKIFNVAKINLNLHSSSYHDGVNPDGDYLNPRTYEIAACGGFQLVDRREYLADQFQIGKEIAVFDNITELKDKIRYYLDHPEERLAIARAGRQRVLAEHTYERRMTEALQFIYSYETAPASRRNPNSVDGMLNVLGDEPELRALLESQRAAGIVTVEEISRQILSRRTGDLTRAEGIFLLMNEFRLWAQDKDLA